MSDDDAASKEHEASEKRKSDAAKKGDVARATDLSSAVTLWATLALLLWGWIATQENISPLAQMFWAPTADDIETALRQAGSRIFYAFLIGLGMLLVINLGLSVLTARLTGTLTFSTQKLQPKLANISLVSGAKNKFGAQGMFEFLKSILKLCAVLGISFVVIRAKIADLPFLFWHAPASGVQTVFGTFFVFLAICAALSLVVGGVDLLVQKKLHARKLRMSRQEVRDEMKENDGDPALKARRRQRAQEISANGGLGEVPKADVVLVNPSHFAVALRWQRDAEAVPRVVAKGQDHLALSIRRIAQENGIPIRRDVATTRSLFALCQIGDPIRAEHYKAVAAAIRFADAVSKRKP